MYISVKIFSLKANIPEQSKILRLTNLLILAIRQNRL